MINIDMGKAGETFRLEIGDTALGFSAAQLLVGTEEAQAMLITCEDGGKVRFAFGGTTPTQGPAGVGHILLDGDGVRISNRDNLESIRLIAKDNTVGAVVQVTPEAAV